MILFWPQHWNSWDTYMYIYLYVDIFFQSLDPAGFNYANYPGTANPYSYYPNIATTTSSSPSTSSANMTYHLVNVPDAPTNKPGKLPPSCNTHITSSISPIGLLWYYYNSTYCHVSPSKKLSINIEVNLFLTFPFLNPYRDDLSQPNAMGGRVQPVLKGLNNFSSKRSTRLTHIGSDYFFNNQCVTLFE